MARKGEKRLKRKVNRSLRTEKLENRELMAVDFSYSHGVLKISGDDGQNHVVVDNVGSKHVRVTTNSTVTNGFSLVPFKKTKTVLRSNLKEIRFYGQDGNDTFINNTSAKSRAYGGDGHDYFKGGSGRDVFYGQAGKDTLHGRGGNDYLHGGSNSDKLYGGSGHDSIYGSSGHDQLYGGSGNDNLRGASGNDRIEGGSGNDTLTGGSNNDRYVFNGKRLGTDTVKGDSGYNTLDFRGFKQSVKVDIEKTSTQTVNRGDLKIRLLEADAVDRVYGSKYGDNIRGNNLRNRIYGFGGNDKLYGDGGNDVLYGGDGHDELYGQSGNDFLDGGPGRDKLNGGSGYDVKRWSTSSVKIELPTDQHQKTWWSCGPNTAYRILKQAGHDVSYGKLKDQAKTNSLVSFFRMGTTPKDLQQVMSRYQSTTMKSQTSFSSLEKVVASGKPVAALLRVGSTRLTAKETAALGAAVGGGAGGLPGGVIGGVLGGVVGGVADKTGNTISVPQLHWVAVSGINKTSKTITYTDTNGSVNTVSYSTFQKKWNWSSGGLAGEALTKAGVKSRTIVY